MSRSARCRQGFTLVELLAALAGAVVLAGLAQRLLLGGQRIARAQAERAALQDNIRVGALVVANELRDLGFDSVPDAAGLGASVAASSDVVSAQPGRIRYRATRGVGFTCAAPAADLLVLEAAGWVGLRPPAAGVDSVAIYLDGDPAVPGDDAWVRAAVSGVSAASCPDGSPALALSLAWAAPALGAAAAARALAGGPVRLFEIMELVYYRSEGAAWLGQRSVSRGEVVQPLVGPLADSTAGSRGLTLAYLDRNGAATTLPADVRSIAVTLRGITAAPVRGARTDRAVPDTFAVASRIALRNMGRP